MSNLALYNISYTKLDASAWCATAQFIAQPKLLLWSWYRPLSPFIALPQSIAFNTLYWQIISYQRFSDCLSVQQIARNKRQQQRYGVRLLLSTLLDQLDIADTLDESEFPYRLLNSRYYVCFSHSQNKVAVVLSHHRTVGIDIEVHDISWQVVQRYYHTTELTILNELSVQQRTTISKLSWQLKESFIKIYHYKLAQGLGITYLAFIHSIIDHYNKNGITDSKISLMIEDKQLQYHIAVLPLQQTVVIF